MTAAFTTYSIIRHSGPIDSNSQGGDSDCGCDCGYLNNFSCDCSQKVQKYRHSKPRLTCPSVCLSVCVCLSVSVVIICSSSSPTYKITRERCRYVRSAYSLSSTLSFPLSFSFSSHFHFHFHSLLFLLIFISPVLFCLLICMLYCVLFSLVLCCSSALLICGVLYCYLHHTPRLSLLFTPIDNPISDPSRP